MGELGQLPDAVSIQRGDLRVGDLRGEATLVALALGAGAFQVALQVGEIRVDLAQRVPLLPKPLDDALVGREVADPGGVPLLDRLVAVALQFGPLRVELADALVEGSDAVDLIALRVAQPLRERVEVLPGLVQLVADMCQAKRLAQRVGLGAGLAGRALLLAEGRQLSLLRGDLALRALGVPQPHQRGFDVACRLQPGRDGAGIGELLRDGVEIEAAGRLLQDRLRHRLVLGRQQVVQAEGVAHAVVDRGDHRRHGRLAILRAGDAGGIRLDLPALVAKVELRSEVVAAQR